MFFLRFFRFFVVFLVALWAAFVAAFGRVLREFILIPMGRNEARFSLFERS